MVFAAEYPDLCERVVLMDLSLGQSTSSEWYAMTRLSRVTRKNSATYRAMAQKMGAKLARDKKLRLGISEGEVDLKVISVHKNRRVAGLAMFATSKAPYDTAEGFFEAALAKIKAPVSIIMGEFDPNLLASPGGAREVAEYLEERGVEVKLVVVESAGHASVKLLPITMGHRLLTAVSQEADKSRL